MTVAELIEKLEQMPKDADVWVFDEWGTSLLATEVGDSEEDGTVFIA